MRGFDLNEYTSREIERFARASFEVARHRKGKVISVDKSNVLLAGVLWREVVGRIASEEFPDIELHHYFGDLISDQAAVIAGSLGMLPSACLPGIPEPGEALGPGIYEPVHGSAPDINGQGIANPIGMILSVGMMLEYNLGNKRAARKIDAAVTLSLKSGALTPDLGGSATNKDVTNSVIRHYRSL